MKRGADVYRRRIERALAKGMSLSAARGHAKHGETAAAPPRWHDDERLAQGLARIVSGETMTAVAKSLRISRERLRRAIETRGSYVREGRRYVFVPDRGNDLPLYSAGRSIRVVVDRANAARLGSYMAAAGRYLRTNRADVLKPFVGHGITDMDGKFHPFETDPEELYILNARGRPDFRILYQPVV